LLESRRLFEDFCGSKTTLQTTGLSASRWTHLGTLHLINTYWTRDLIRNAGREYLKVVLQENFPFAPICLKYGLADYYSSLEVDGLTMAYGRVDQDHLARLRSEGMLPIKDLIKIRRGDMPEGKKLLAFYSQSWLLTHFLVHNVAGTRDAIGEILTSMRSGSTMSRAMEEVLGVPLDALDEPMDSYRRNSRWSFSKLRTQDEWVESPTPPIDVSRSEMLARIGIIRLVFSGQDSSAAERYSLAAIDTDSSCVMAHVGRACVRYRTKRYAAVLEDLTVAEALETPWPEVHWLAGDALLKLAEQAARAQDPELQVTLLRKARSRYESCLEAGFDPPDLCRNYAATFEPASESKWMQLRALDRARLKSPWSWELFRAWTLTAVAAGDFGAAWHKLATEGQDRFSKKSRQKLSNELWQLLCARVLRLDAEGRSSSADSLLDACSGLLVLCSLGDSLEAIAARRHTTQTVEPGLSGQ